MQRKMHVKMHTKNWASSFCRAYSSVTRRALTMATRNAPKQILPKEYVNARTAESCRAEEKNDEASRGENHHVATTPVVQ